MSAFDATPASVWFEALVELLQHQHVPRVEEKLTNDGGSEITVRPLDELRVAELDGVTEIGERIFAPPFPFDLPRELEQGRRLANEVECDVRERDVFLENRRVPAPLGESMAEDEPVIRESKQVFEERILRLPRGRRRRPRSGNPAVRDVRRGLRFPISDSRFPSHRPRTPRGVL